MCSRLLCKALPNVCQLINVALKLSIELNQEMKHYQLCLHKEREVQAKELRSKCDVKDHTDPAPSASPKAHFEALQRNWAAFEETAL